MKKIIMSHSVFMYNTGRLISENYFVSLTLMREVIKPVKMYRYA
jgi:hypothetical protein